MKVSPFLMAALSLYLLILPSLLRRVVYAVRGRPDPVPTTLSQWVYYWLMLASIPTWALPAWLVVTIALGMGALAHEVVTYQVAGPTLLAFGVALILDQGMRVQRQLRVTD